MKRSVLTLLIISALFILVQPANPQNPFTPKNRPPEVSRSAPLPNTLLAQIAHWQHQLNRKMTALAREARATQSIRPFLSLFIIAFAYGIMHAAGPGHGKAVAAIYIISSNRNPGSGIIFGNLIALFHGLSGILLVLIVNFILQQRITGTLAKVGVVTQRISYALIALLGTYLLIKNVYLWIRRTVKDRRFHKDDAAGNFKGPVSAALAVGMVPCPGVVLVMLFAMSLNMIGIGILLALCVTLGMAMTITAVVIVGIIGKKLMVGVFDRRRRIAGIIEQGIETLASLMLTVLGIVFLAATF